MCVCVCVCVCACVYACARALEHISAIFDVQKVLHVAPQLFLQRCSTGPLLSFCFSKELGSRTVEHALWTVVLSGMSNLQSVPALVMYPDWSCLAWVVILQSVPALVMYPDCGPVWHGQDAVCASPSHVPRLVLSGMGSYSSVCASPSHVPRLWSCLAWAGCSVCQP